MSAPIIRNICSSRRAFFHRTLSLKKRFSSSIHALIYDEYGDPTKVVQLETLNDLPLVDKKSIRIKMLASPINPADINTIQGIYPVKPPLPAVGGFEGVGEVVEIKSGASDIKVGDMVIPAINSLGTWRSQVVCPSDCVTVLPEGTPRLFAATLRVNTCTSYRMLADFQDLQAGDTVIQNAANSGAGQMAIQIAAARGLKTINIVRDRPNVDELKAHLHNLGADIVVTDTELRMSSPQKLLQGLPKPKLGLNAVGGKSAISLMKYLQNGGTMVTYGGMSKQPVTVPTGMLIFNDIKVVGYWMTRWHDNNPNSVEAARMFDELCQWSKEGRLCIPRHRLVNIKDYKSGIESAMADFTTEKQILVFDN
ncbi:enoyl-[acyl-carrier-protein] reductase, mitochondrial-like [Anneissia japonica]|uniref:enoyl-[acyl-carrier-protein] reductase, mitochondrial-like n=1 Tax=Anneissia japonica TaxID=1529436 RepID=UPI0014259EF2|nr:enoyl-[acyl-carrier-protein] reductase, mitochondrial-like [Anneissia japonica]